MDAGNLPRAEPRIECGSQLVCADAKETGLLAVYTDSGLKCRVLQIGLNPNEHWFFAHDRYEAGGPPDNLVEIGSLHGELILTAALATPAHVLDRTDDARDPGLNSE
jgi:hypothetical protein